MSVWLKSSNLWREKIKFQTLYSKKATLLVITILVKMLQLHNYIEGKEKFPSFGLKPIKNWLLNYSQKWEVQGNLERIQLVLVSKC